MITNDDILQTLERIRTDSKRQRYMKAPDTYKNFMPQRLPTKPWDTSMAQNNLDYIAQIGKNATEVAATKAQNKKSAQENAAQSAALLRAQRQADSLKTPAQITKVYNPKGIQFKGMQTKKAPTGVDPYAPIKTYVMAGRSVQLNSSVAPRFVNLVGALQKKGYKIYSLGGYANRNIAGTSRRSLHSYGLALDINPSSNPVTYGGRGAVKTNLPPGVAALAAKYGLAWGGNWNGSKQDPMHFSVPAFGTK